MKTLIHTLAKNFGRVPIYILGIYDEETDSIMIWQYQQANFFFYLGFSGIDLQN